MDREGTKQLIAFLAALTAVSTMLIISVAVTMADISRTDRLAIEHGYSKMSLPGMQSAYWVKNGTVYSKEAKQ